MVALVISLAGAWSATTVPHAGRAGGAATGNRTQDSGTFTGAEIVIEIYVHITPPQSQCVCVCVQYFILQPRAVSTRGFAKITSQRNSISEQLSTLAVYLQRTSPTQDSSPVAAVNTSTRDLYSQAMDPVRGLNPGVKEEKQQDEMKEHPVSPVLLSHKASDLLHAIRETFTQTARRGMAFRR